VKTNARSGRQGATGAAFIDWPTSSAGQSAISAYTIDGEQAVFPTAPPGEPWVRSGVIHTNSIKSVWALLKRQIYGIHHWVSVKHMDRYLSEATWRYNRRSLGAANETARSWSG
jgi:hypothetical protein